MYSVIFGSGSVPEETSSLLVRPHQRSARRVVRNLKPDPCTLESLRPWSLLPTLKTWDPTPKIADPSTLESTLPQRRFPDQNFFEQNIHLTLTSSTLGLNPPHLLKVPDHFKLQILNPTHSGTWTRICSSTRSAGNRGRPGSPGRHEESETLMVKVNWLTWSASPRRLKWTVITVASHTNTSATNFKPSTLNPEQVPGPGFLRAPDPLVLDIQLVHDGHLLGRAGPANPHVRSQLLEVLSLTILLQIQ